MKIAAIGSPERLEELSSKLSSVGMSYTRLESTKNIHLKDYEIIFDLNFDDDGAAINDYSLLPTSCILMLSGVKMQIEANIPSKLWQNVVFINALPGFLGRNAMEYCTLIDDFNHEIFLQLGWESSNRTASRVGMVSPRVVLMIINEAYFTFQEGTASKEDIDKGMKLGTAYPMGPFEWCQKLGIKNVFDILSALYKDTMDERYRICSRLKTDYLLSHRFNEF